MALVFIVAMRGKYIDEAVLDATLTIAGEMGVGAREVFGEVSQSTADAGAAIFQQHINDLHQ